MNELTIANRAANWQRLKTLVLDNVSAPITKRVYNLGLMSFSPGSAWNPGPSAVLMPRILVECRHYWERVASLVEESSRAQRANHGWFPPKHAFASALRSFLHNPI